MKKLISLILALSLVIITAGCGKPKNNESLGTAAGNSGDNWESRGAYGSEGYIDDPEDYGSVNTDGSRVGASKNSKSHGEGGVNGGDSASRNANSSGTGGSGNGAGGGSSPALSSGPEKITVANPSAKDGSGKSYTAKAAAQKSIAQIEKMPNMPPDYQYKDYSQAAKNFDKIVFDYSKKGQYLPLIANDIIHRNVDFNCAAITAYVGKSDFRVGSQESIVYMPAVLSGALVGINKSNQDGRNFIRMSQTFFQKGNSENVFVSTPDQYSATCDFWYMIYPTLDFMAMANLYPDVQDMVDISKKSANSWYNMLVDMRQNHGGVTFDYAGYNFKTKQLMKNLPGAIEWKEPDAAAGVAAIMIYAYQLTGDSKYMQGAEWCLTYLDARPVSQNPFYEIMLTYAPLMAARIQAQNGKKYNIEKYMNWIFSCGKTSRGYFGIATGSFAGIRADGLCMQYDPKNTIYDISTEKGKENTHRTILWAMNSMTFPTIITPTARYDQSYARALGKYTLNAVANSRYFYGNSMPENNQTDSVWQKTYDASYSIPYESIEYNYKGIKPCLTGDPKQFGWGETNLSLYSGAAAGKLGSMVSKTEVSGILQLDLLKTDYFEGKAFPSYIYYNPHAQAKTVSVKLPQGSYDVYDAVSDLYQAVNISGTLKISVPADSAMVIVIAPAGSKRTEKNSNIYINDTFVGLR